MIRAGRPEDLKAIYGLKKIQLSLSSDSQELYFQNQFEYHNVVVNEVNGQIKASLQLDYQPIMLKDRKLMCSIITGQFYDGRNGNYFGELLDDVMKQLQATTLISAVFANKTDRYQKLGFEQLYSRRVYTIKRSQLKNVADSGISRKFSLKELSELYERFTSHFDGYMIRNSQYWSRLLDYYTFLNWFAVIYRDEKGHPQGYMIYHIDNDILTVEEIVYTSGLALMRLLSYATRNKPQIYVKVSQYEDLSIAVAGAKFKVENNAEVRINDRELYERLYNESCDSTATALLSSSKPLWISRGY